MKTFTIKTMPRDITVKVKIGEFQLLAKNNLFYTLF